MSILREKLCVYDVAKVKEIQKLFLFVLFFFLLWDYSSSFPWMGLLLLHLLLFSLVSLVRLGLIAEWWFYNDAFVFQLVEAGLLHMLRDDVVVFNNFWICACANASLFTFIHSLTDGSFSPLHNIYISDCN